VPALQQLVVVIPGIGGSVLRPAGERGGGWEVSRFGLARAVVRPSALHIDRELVPTDLISSCTVFPPFFTIAGYEDLRLHFLSRFTDPVVRVWGGEAPVDECTDVLLFPYDFRRSVAEAAKDLDRAVWTWLRQVPERVRPGRVVLLAHSMGGLVARYWLGPLGGYPWCKSLITLGTPHRGAPKALTWLMNGPPVPRATEVLRGWPSVYELLPQYEAVWDEAAGRPVEFTDVPVSMRDQAGYASRFSAMAAAARKVHREIFDAWAGIDPELRPAVVPYMGRGHATPNTLVLHDGRLRITKQDPPWRGNVRWRGDGTVPMLSAIPRELGEDRHKPLWRVVADRHLPLGSTPAPFTLLEMYAGQPVPSRGGDTPDRPWLALDLDEVVEAGTPVRVDAWVEPERAVADEVRILVDPLAGGPVHEDRCNRSDVGWTVSVPPLPPGLYEVTVEARGGDVGLLTATDVVAVVDTGELAEEDR
jgi:hypothetical protein